ncbi:HepT-like ribonuclease domain-containing protein [Lyngbya confervoides]|uniref:DUF86 domain-containing protein n=1 Tax=Lyngbya confervoides BDU141951 TaxID=1574623 RepID=A0ABD4T2S6_9CYAN|nr:HepT-like ribonuclease domain-containing protein [Lyngbya confervoides]MCM1982691.1 DUF86 domain-containing protein [Lyngbya confervoides BDU141951]
MSRSLKLYSNDIKTSIDKIQSYTQGLGKDDFLNNPLILDAVTLNLQIIGEARKNIPQNIPKKIPASPLA